MSGDQLLTVLLAVIAAVGASFVTGLFSRPVVKADADAKVAGGEVAISGDARAWAQQFAEQAAAATARANTSDEHARAAQERAERAEEKADDAIDRCDQLEVKFYVLTDYAKTLQREVVRQGGTVPDPPASLRPPL